MKTILLLAIFTTTVTAFAEESQFSGATEASAVVISGNANNETYSAKTENTYAVSEFDLAKIFGKYVRSTSGGTESTKAWEAGLRYERIFTKDVLSAFLQHKAEHDPYNGIFIQRDSTDIGMKYTFIKTDAVNWFSELGYQYTTTYVATGVDKASGDFIRAYTEVAYKISASTSTKLWVEHLSPLKSGDKSRTNAELSLSVAMTNIFSLKTAYLINHNEAAVSPLKKDTTTWTTALVAKY